MSGRGITQLEGFEDFVTLEVLWINDNKLTRIEGMECLVNLRVLWLCRNNIETIGTGIGTHSVCLALTVMMCTRSLGFPLGHSTCRVVRAFAVVMRA